MRNATLVYLVKKENGVIRYICLAMKKRGFGVGKWNGAGGKVEEGEGIEEAAARETKEEIGVVVKDLKKIGELSFLFPNNPAWDQLVHMYFCEKWEGEISETEEMSPDWFEADKLPFDKMWADDPYWWSKALAGDFIEGYFSFGNSGEILNFKLAQ